MGVNSLPKTVTRQCRGCDLNAGPTAPESSTLTLGYGATSMGQRNQVATVMISTTRNTADTEIETNRQTYGHTTIPRDD